MLPEHLHIQMIPSLYLFVQDGCEACAAAAPAWERLRREDPTSLIIIPLHVNRRDWDILGWRPKGTPGYALVVNGRLVKKHVGALDYKELKTWLGEVLE